MAKQLADCNFISHSKNKHANDGIKLPVCQTIRYNLGICPTAPVALTMLSYESVKLLFFL